MANLNFNNVFKSNELGIPILDIDMQCKTIEMPLDVYGRNSRNSQPSENSQRNNHIEKR